MWSSPGRRVAEGEEVAREITSAGGSALYVQADVGREGDIVALVEKTVGAFGALHVAFNNAGTEGQFGLLVNRADGRALPSGLRRQHPRRAAVDEARDPDHVSAERTLSKSSRSSQFRKFKVSCGLDKPTSWY